ncbi:MAG TPA: ASCH domain-containing protein [Candidatus Saccharimonadales bacterium]|nr:ASCH domain-containing protein [Candidatus Saccharimonadales bacterium]
MIFRSEVDEPTFELILSKKRIIEPRLYDEIHAKIKAGDMIVFINRETKKEIVAKVVGILRFGSFKELFNSYPTERFGKTERELLADMRQFYGEKELALGVAGFKIHNLN